MVWTIARRELADQLTSLRFLTVTLLAVGLTPLTVYVGARDYVNRLADYSRLAADKQKLAAASRTVIRAGPVLRAIRAPEPLSVLVRGLDGALPEYWDFSEGGVVEGPLAMRPQRLLDILGQLDLEFLVRVVLGLLAILLAFDAVAGEKELGTLRAVLSQSVSRPAFLGGKLVGGAATLLVALAVAFLLALLSAQLFGIDLAGGNLVKVALIAAGSAAYLLAMYAFGLLISALSGTQKTALVVLLVTWVVAVLAMPPLATLVAQAVVPAPPPQATEQKKQALSADLKRELDTAMGVALLEITGQPLDSPTVRMNWGDAKQHQAELEARATPLRRAYASKRRQFLGEVERDADRRAAQQNRLARVIMALSPAATFAGAATDLAGTGDAQREAWLAAIRRHQGELDSVLFDDPPIMTFSRFTASGASSMSGNWKGEPKLSELPPFSGPRQEAVAAIDAALPGLGLLALYAALFIAGGFFAFARYDVR